MRDKPFRGAMFESLRLFALCSAMEWAQLPVAGGIYDQHPKLLEEWIYIFGARSRAEKEDQARREREMKAKSPPSR